MVHWGVLGGGGATLSPPELVIAPSRKEGLHMLTLSASVFVLVVSAVFHANIDHRSLPNIDSSDIVSRAVQPTMYSMDAHKPDEYPVQLYNYYCFLTCSRYRYVPKFSKSGFCITPSL